MTREAVEREGDMEMGRLGSDEVALRGRRICERPREVRREETRLRITSKEAVSRYSFLRNIEGLPFIASRWTTL